MTIYIVIVEDARTDVQAYPYSTPEKAIAAAQKYFDTCEGAEDVDPEDQGELTVAGLLENGSAVAYTDTEGDCVTVVAMELDVDPDNWWDKS